MKKSEIRSMFNMCTVSTIESKVLFVFRINQYHATGIFLYPLKILENLFVMFSWLKRETSDMSWVVL